MPPRTYRMVFVIVAALALITDIASKYGMFRWLYPANEVQLGIIHGERDVIEGWFKFVAEFNPTTKPNDGLLGSLQTWSAPVMPRVNQGALFGMGGNHKSLANGIFAGISILAVVGVIIWVWRSAVKEDAWMCIALGLILGGAIGNFYDRVVFDGVRDFLYFYKIDWPVFNIADTGLVIGAIMLVIHAFFFTPPGEKPKGNAVETAVVE